jgi:hypothetical protein
MPFDGNAEKAELGLILFAAADLIKRNGWCQHSFQNGVGETCAAGAIKAVAAGSYPAALRLFQLRLGVEHVGRWNDDPARTKEEVIAALEAAV